MYEKVRSWDNQWKLRSGKRDRFEKVVPDQHFKNAMPHSALCMMLNLAGLKTFSCMNFKCFDLYLMTGNLYMPLSGDGFVRGPAKSMHIHWNLLSLFCRRKRRFPSTTWRSGWSRVCVCNQLGLSLASLCHLFIRRQFSCRLCFPQWKLCCFCLCYNGEQVISFPTLAGPSLTHSDL